MVFAVRGYLTPETVQGTLARKTLAIFQLFKFLSHNKL